MYFLLVNDATLGILVEYVNSFKLNSNPNAIACSDLGTGRNTCDKVLVLILKTSMRSTEWKV